MLIVSNENNVSQFIEIIKRNHLYVQGWLIRDWIDYPACIEMIALYSENNVWVGCAIKTCHASVNVGVYVKPEYRRRGIGTKLFRIIAQNYNDITYGCGTTEFDTNIFFEKNLQC